MHREGLFDINSFKYYIPAIIILLRMNLLHIHISTRYIHGMNMRSMENALLLTLHH
jgi:hypothetical protein